MESSFQSANMTVALPILDDFLLPADRMKAGILRLRLETTMTRPLLLNSLLPCNSPAQTPRSGNT